MQDYHFISYSSVEALDFARKLTDALQGGHPPIPVWFDKDRLRPAEEWDEQIVAALRNCKTLLFVMTPDSVHPKSVCKQEWSRALSYKKPVIPLVLDPHIEVPFRLELRQRIDFSGNFEVGLARLRKHLLWLDTPEGELKTLEERLEDAQRALRRTTSERETARVEDEIAELEKQIAKQKRLIADPQAEQRKTERSIQAGLERERKPERPVGGESRTKFINPPPALAPTYFQDRFIEVGLIEDFLKDESKRMLTIVGRAGVGKTALAVRVLKALESGHLPDDRGPLPVDGIVYLSAVGGHRVTLPNLYADLCKCLPKEQAGRLDALYKDPHMGTRAKMAALLEAFPNGRTLVLLDNFETLVDGQNREINDEELGDALCALLALPHHGVKVILTTRVAPRDLTLTHPACHSRITLDEGLESPHAENILRAMDADGKLGIRDASDELLDRARRRTRGFPRALEALYAILAADRETTLVDLLEDDGAPLPDNVVEALVGEAFSRLDPLAQRVMEALAVYNRPVSPAAVDYLLQPFRPGIDSAPVLGRLVNMHFVHTESGRYYLHPADQEYAFARMPDSPASPRERGDRGGWSQTTLLSRAADYFRQARQPRASWQTLDDLTPQLAEFELRCQAGDYETAARVLTDIDYDYLLLWGHYRLMIQMHERLRGKLSGGIVQLQHLNNLGLVYSYIGEVQESIDCYQAALPLTREKENRQAEGAILGNLGSAYAALGETRRAIDFYQDALAIAREIGDKRSEGSDLGNLGSAYAALGETRRAIEYHEDALAIAREIGDRSGEGNHLGNLGNLGSAYAALGETRRAIEYHEQALAISREIGDKRNEGAFLGNLGLAYANLGETRRAIEYHEDALAIAREIGDKRGEGNRLGNLGLAYAALGETRRAIEYHQQALAIAREIGDKRGEGADLGSLGNAYAALGETRRAIEYYEQALAIAQEIGDKRGEGNRLGNLGNRYAELGNIQQAQTYYQQALAIHREIGKRQSESIVLETIGHLLLDQGRWEQAEGHFQEAISIADEISFPAVQMDARRLLSLTYLYTNKLSEARVNAESACQYDVAQYGYYAHLALGIITLRQGDHAAAASAFRAAVEHADELLAKTPKLYDALDAKGLALCGLALLSKTSEVSEDFGSLKDAARDAFAQARAITTAPGHVGRVVRQFEALAQADEQGVLKGMRAAIEGEGNL
jgi:tetratricopeptide (TPR) repeat protein